MLAGEALPALGKQQPAARAGAGGDPHPRNPNHTTWPFLCPHDGSPPPHQYHQHHQHSEAQQHDHGAELPVSGAVMPAFSPPMAGSDDAMSPGGHDHAMAAATFSMPSSSSSGGVAFQQPPSPLSAMMAASPGPLLSPGGHPMSPAGPDVNPLKPLSEVREAIQRRMSKRPTREQLMQTNVLKGFSSAPTLHATQEALQRAKTENILTRKMQVRPSKQDLVNRSILKSASSLSPTVLSRQEAIQRHQLEGRLAEKLEDRPGPLDLVYGRLMKPEVVGMLRSATPSPQPERSARLSGGSVLHGDDIARAPTPPPLPPSLGATDMPGTCADPTQPQRIRQPQGYRVASMDAFDMGGFGLAPSPSSSPRATLHRPTPLPHDHQQRQRFGGQGLMLDGSYEHKHIIENKLSRLAQEQAKEQLHQELQAVQRKAIVPQAQVAQRVHAVQPHFSALEPIVEQLQVQAQHMAQVHTEIKQFGQRGTAAAPPHTSQAPVQRQPSGFRLSSSSIPKGNKTNPLKKFRYHEYKPPNAKTRKRSKRRKKAANPVQASAQYLYQVEQQKTLLALEDLVQRQQHTANGFVALAPQHPMYHANQQTPTPTHQQQPQHHHPQVAFPNGAPGQYPIGPPAMSAASVMPPQGRPQSQPLFQTAAHAAEWHARVQRERSFSTADLQVLHSPMGQPAVSDTPSSHAAEGHGRRSGHHVRAQSWGGFQEPLPLLQSAVSMEDCHVPDDPPASPYHQQYEKSGMMAPQLTVMPAAGDSDGFELPSLPLPAFDPDDLELSLFSMESEENALPSFRDLFTPADTLDTVVGPLFPSFSM